MWPKKLLPEAEGMGENHGYGLESDIEVACQGKRKLVSKTLAFDWGVMQMIY